MYNFLCLYYCSYFFQFLAFTRISKFLLKMLKVHQKKMVIINFANKWEIIIIIQDKKNRDKFFARWKKIGEKNWSGKRKSGKHLVACKKFSHFSPTFFSPIRWGFRATIWHNYSTWPLHIQSGHIQNSGLFRTEGIFKSLPNISDKHAYSEPWHNQDSLFNHFQRYLGIFRDIDAY